MTDVNFDDDTRVEKLANGRYIYLVKQEHVFEQVEDELRPVWDSDEHTRLRDRLLNRPPYVNMPLI